MCDKFVNLDFNPAINKKKKDFNPAHINYYFINCIFIFIAITINYDILVKTRGLIVPISISLANL